ncbi:hypothetical protein C0J52_08587 [Blattella germanica]|nr:hypothetical protein C0J52_08587 [Blattella germanica]
MLILTGWSWEFSAIKLPILVEDSGDFSGLSVVITGSDVELNGGIGREEDDTIVGVVVVGCGVVVVVVDVVVGVGVVVVVVVVGDGVVVVVVVVVVGGGVVVVVVVEVVVVGNFVVVVGGGGTDDESSPMSVATAASCTILSVTVADAAGAGSPFAGKLV